MITLALGGRSSGCLSGQCSGNAKQGTAMSTGCSSFPKASSRVWLLIFSIKLLRVKMAVDACWMWMTGKSCKMLHHFR